MGGPAGSWQDRQRTAAVQDAARRAGAELTVLGPCPATFAAGVEVTASVLETGASAVVPYATSIEALGLEHTPAIDVDGEELGRTAMDLLARQLDGQDEPGRQVRLPVPVRG